MKRQYYDDSVGFFMECASMYRRISVQEENILAKKIALGDRDALEELVNSNLRLVVKIAHDFTGKGIPFGDLIGAGNLGLINAARKFDPTKGAKFGSYASWWIKAMMQKEVARMSHSISMAPSSYRKLKKINTVKKALGNAATPERIAKEIGHTKAYFVRSIMDGCYTVSMNDTILNGEMELSEKIPEEKIKNPLEAMVEDESISMMKEAFKNVLTDEEKYVIRLRYGFCEGNQKHTLQSIATSMNITHQRVAQIEKIAIEKMREVMTNEK